MRKLIFTLLALTIAFTGFSQEEEEDGQKKSPAKERLLVGVGIDGALFANELAGFEQNYIGSRGFNISALYDYPFGSSNFSIALGVGLGAQNIASNARISPTTVNPASCDSTKLMVIPDSVDYDKNKLSTNYIDIPFELRFRSNPDKNYRRWSIAAGFKLGFLVQSHTKYEDNNGKLKSYAIANLNSLRYGPSFRFGYGKVNLFGQYFISTLFDDGKGPEINTFNAGIMFIPY